MAKAQAKLIEYTLTILLSVLVMISIIAIAYTFYLNVLENEIRESLKQIALYTSDNIIKIYQTAKTVKAQPSNQTSILIKEIDLSLPTDISKRNYEVILVNPNPLWLTIRNFTIDGENVSTIVETSGPKVIAQTTQDPIIKVEHSLPNIDVNLQGKVENGREDKLRYYRYNINETIRDVAVLGEADILIDITNMS